MSVLSHASSAKTFGKTQRIPTSLSEEDEDVCTMKSRQQQDDDLKIKKDDDGMTLLLIRMLYVAYYAANGFLHPFIPEYYTSKGYGGQIVGLIGSITPFITFLVGPLWGVISDSWQAPYFILYTTMTVSLVGQLLDAVVDNPYVVMGLVSIKSFFAAPVRSIIDSLVLEQIHDRKSFGRMRLWGLIGSGIGTSLGGYFLAEESQKMMHAWGQQYYSSGGLFETMFGHLLNLAGYPFLFFAHTMLHIPLYMVMRRLQYKQNNKDDPIPEPPATAKSSKTKTETNGSSNNHQSTSLSSREILLSIIKNQDAIVFFMLVYAMGVAGGIADNFTYSRFREMGASSMVMGNSRLFSSSAGAIMFWFSGDVSAFLGSDAVMVLSLLLVALRFWLYATIDLPWTAFVGEGLRGLTFGCFWSSATVSASELAPKEARSTMLLILNGAYNGIGRSTGAVVGGYIESVSGSKAIFEFGYMTYITVACVYVTCLQFRRTKTRPAPKDKKQ